jgi:hypothetical protein
LEEAKIAKKKEGKREKNNFNHLGHPQVCITKEG